ncbi:hypothetical protein BDZ90DRAFT_8775 [Jaminaea rosea]|uniref:Prokaryotic-type class I peptide chain release factors domain-containing protein n=1 Tax=Jaminaea rosea TaxID=1569628 RepID=A0A316UYJ0_9BASI|nr:hypothetical protein BDZ90DRAFT_8775 [Jaminaea rosea]PWN30282.1 hypothetical protein BDZ90DRAFT_8775 [Jaminaea rosea]
MTTGMNSISDRNGPQLSSPVSTKANVRLSLAAATAEGRVYEQEKSPFPLPIPREVARRAAKESPYYAASSQSLLVSSSQSRSQEANLENAIDKLCNHLHSLAAAGLVGETSSQQREKVQRLAEREKGKMKQLKQKRADVKMGRKKITTWD